MNGRRLPKPTEGQRIPAPYDSAPTTANGGIERSGRRRRSGTWFARPEGRERVDASRARMDELGGGLPDRSGNAKLALRLNQASHRFPPPILWLLVGVVALVVRRTDRSSRAGDAGDRGAHRARAERARNPVRAALRRARRSGVRAARGRQPPRTAPLSLVPSPRARAGRRRQGHHAGRRPRTSSPRSATTIRAISRRRRRSSARPASAASTRSSSRSATTAALYTRALYDAPYDNENSFGGTYGEHREALELSASDWLELREFSREEGVTLFAHGLRRGERRLPRRARHAGLQDRLGRPREHAAPPPRRRDRQADVRLDRRRRRSRTSSAPSTTMLPLNEQLCVLQCTASYPCRGRGAQPGRHRDVPGALPRARDRALRPSERHRDVARRATCSARASSRSTSRSTTPGRARTTRSR